MDIINKENYNVIQCAEDTEKQMLLLQNIHTEECIYVPICEEILKEFGETQTFMPSSTEKIWTEENTLLLIDTVIKHDKIFSSGMKKNGWEKVSDECKKVNPLLTQKQCESKWKSLKRTYKSVLAQNKTTGNKKKDWAYFDILHEYFFTKPEFSPLATASSISGVNVNKENVPSTSSTLNEAESTFSKKRKRKQSDMERRHEEKLKRLDRFNDLFEKMIEKMK